MCTFAASQVPRAPGDRPLLDRVKPFHHPVILLGLDRPVPSVSFLVPPRPCCRYLPTVLPFHRAPTTTLGVTVNGSTSDNAVLVDDHQLARHLASEAGQALLDLREGRRKLGRTDTWSLRDEADRLAHDLLVDRLARHRPSDIVMSEEGRDDPIRLEAPRTWIIDPLDGTHDYPFDGSIEWAVHVALVSDSRPTAGAVAVPAIGKVFGTDLARFADRGQRPEPLVICGRSNVFYGTEVADALDGSVSACGSSGFKAMLVVDGVVDVYVHASGLYEWDVCAPAAVAAATGLVVSDIHGQRIDYNKPNPTVEGLVISRPEYAKTTQATLRRLGV